MSGVVHRPLALTLLPAASQEAGSGRPAGLRATTAAPEPGEVLRLPGCEVAGRHGSPTAAQGRTVASYSSSTILSNLPVPAGKWRDASLPAPTVSPPATSATPATGASKLSSASACAVMLWFTTTR